MSLTRFSLGRTWEGYIEGSGDNPGLWTITTGDTAKNEYLIALAGDQEALKTSFEGKPKPEKAPAGEKTEKSTQQSISKPEPSSEPEGTPDPGEAPAAEPTQPVDDDEMAKLDDMLANLES